MQMRGIYFFPDLITLYTSIKSLIPTHAYLILTYRYLGICTLHANVRLNLCGAAEKISQRKEWINIYWLAVTLRSPRSSRPIINLHTHHHHTSPQLHIPVSLTTKTKLHICNHGQRRKSSFQA
jgi:hypothetical protein